MRDPDRLVWKDVLAHLRKAYPTLCRQWFDEIELVGIDGGALVLRAHTPHHRDYLRRHCLDQFNDAVRTVTGRLLAVRFVGPDETTGIENRPPTGHLAPEGSPLDLALADEALEPSQLAEPKPAASEPASGVWNGQGRATTVLHPPGPSSRPAYYSSEAEPLGPGSLVINPDYDFENFIVGPSNRIAHAAGQAVGTHPGRSYNPLFIHGPVGLGKTHLLQAICLSIKRTNPAATIHYISCEAFISDYVDRVRAGAMAEFRHRFRGVDVLVIDDIHFLTKREQTQEEFFHTFNTLYQAHKQIVLSSDRPPDAIPELQDRLVSRFKWGLVAQIDPPVFETRVAILQSKAAIRGIHLPDDVALFIANRVTANIRELEGAITKLQLRAMVDACDINLAMAQEAIGAGTPSSQSDLTVQAIIDVVIQYYSVRLQDLQSKKRQRSIALPRQVCMYLARRHTRQSLQEIGRHFGGRDHTTVMHAIRTVDTRREADREFGFSIQTLEQLLSQTRQ